MDLDGFFVTLPSNASMNIYPENTKANFTTKLYKPIRFNTQYEVALVEITTPSIEENEQIFLGSIEIHYVVEGKEEYFGVNIFSKMFHESSLTKILNTINNAISMMNNQLEEKKRILEPPQFKEVLQFPNQVNIKFNKYSPNTHVYLFGQLADILGFPKSSKETFIKLLPDMTSITLSYSSFTDMQFNKSNMFIYTDIIKFQYVGDVSRQLLRVVNNQGRHHQNSIIYSTPHYVSVLSDLIDTIKITIKDDKNKIIQFRSGSQPVILKLHFRPKRYGF